MRYFGNTNLAADRYRQISFDKWEVEIRYECVQRENDNDSQNQPTQNKTEHAEIGVNLVCRTAIVIRVTPTVMMMTPGQKEEQNVE
jgi:hypothetical protein